MPPWFRNLLPIGTGYRWHVTGLVHDETGFPKGTPAATVAAQDRLRDKLMKHLDDIVTVENYKMDDAEFAVVAYGGASRSVYEAVDMARKEGSKLVSSVLLPSGRLLTNKSRNWLAR
jgi:2-oxoglutarate ferredoxin oxidoreductase subunit alpha